MPVVTLEKSARKFLERLGDKRLRKRLDAAIGELEIEPMGTNCRKLSEVLYRKRVGNYRIIYRWQGGSILITLIAHRSRIYQLMMRQLLLVL